MTFNPSKRQALGRSFVARDSVAATQSTFFGTKAPAEVTQLALLLPNTDQATFIKLLKFVLEYIKGTEVIIIIIIYHLHLAMIINQPFIVLNYLLFTFTIIVEQ